MLREAEHELSKGWGKAAAKGSLYRGVLHISEELLLLLGILEEQGLLPEPWDIGECLCALMPRRPSCPPGTACTRAHGPAADGAAEPERASKAGPGVDSISFLGVRKSQLW